MGESFLEWLRTDPSDTWLPTYERCFAGNDFEQTLNEMAKILTKQNLSQAEIEQKIAFVYFRDRLSSWFESIGTNKAHAYQNFSKKIARPGDWFLSFNYDICLEHSLHQEGIWNIEDGYGFHIAGFDQHSDTTLVKVHGSINWTIPVRTGTPDRPVISRKDLKALGYSNHFDQSIQEPFVGAGPLLSVPTTEKKFYVSTSVGHRFETFWQHLWDMAGQRLKESDEVIICGYSLPLADKLARQVLFSSITKTARIEIVCGSAGQFIAEEFHRAGFKQVHVPKKSHFEEWVASKSMSE